MAADIKFVGLVGASYFDLATACCITVLVVTPTLILAHELGHAIIALRATSGPVVVHVGRPPGMVRLKYGRLEVVWSLVPARWGQFAGVCLWNPTGVSRRARLIFILAGPIMTSLLIPAFLLAAIACGGMPGWISATWTLSAIGAFAALLVDTYPWPASRVERAAGASRRDGPRAVAAYRAWRQYVPEID